MSEYAETTKIINSKGLHARPAGKIVAMANDFGCELTITLDGKTADAHSIIDLMTLSASCGSELEIAGTGNDAEAAVKGIVSLIEQGFEEK
jgi:phosphotransferase system HPr (HPr) family protein